MTLRKRRVFSFQKKFPAHSSAPGNMKHVRLLGLRGKLSRRTDFIISYSAITDKLFVDKYDVSSYGFILYEHTLSFWISYMENAYILNM